MIADLVRNNAAWQAVMDGVPVTSLCWAERSADGWEAGVSPGGSFESDGMAGRPHRRKAWLRRNDEDVQRVIASSPFDEPGTRAKYFDTPKSVYSLLSRAQVLIGDRLVGLSTCAGRTADGGGRLSLAMLDEAVARDGAEVTLARAENGGGTRKPAVERHVPTYVRATLGTRRLVRCR